ncbi:PAS domain S-box protein [Rhizobium sp. ARZ01]|uniref:PAS domain S-box protein n=1 Tax=Rhizobium sp. ARZ01 TaxID=2769313 RepID=UPI0017865628|nr:PAS domain S-box protein [Rhizobium sp. ARZ01]MBD9375587.1 PAS domain S-box protein [Rhizobium sp. ARZ01]
MAKQPAINSDNTGHKRARGRRISEATENTSASAPDIPVVGIGASAGGIEALGSFFDAMPPDSGCAFVVVLHLDPNRESEMASILSGRTAMPVVQVEDEITLVPNQVYVIAPDTDLKLTEGGLDVSRPMEPRGQRHPVDVLFASIAAGQRQRSVAIVLSGTGSDGTEGLKEIRAEGGMSLVQAPDSAKFDGMPRSAIAAGLADHVLAPDKMPETLIAYVRHGYVTTSTDVEPVSAKGTATIEQVLEEVHANSGHDFGNYKRNTLRRRIHRRMGLRNIETLANYLDDLRENPEEVAMLAADLMISVTGFFRDLEAWKALAELVIGPLVAERESGGSIRVWVPACATGEEAYSVAILITEQAEAAGKRFDLKVFATDAQEDNLRKAREGIYPAAALAGFPPERIRRFFERLDGSYQVSKQLRDMVLFATQNLLRDPPFSRLDLVTCRNFLIYLEAEAQQRVIAQWHYALHPDGHLFLGNAETIGRYDDLFDTISKKWRIYRRTGPTRHNLIDYRQVRDRDEPGSAGESRPTPSQTTSEPMADIARRALLERAPASVLIDHKGRVVYFHGSTRDYLEQPSGEPTRDLLAMARDGLGLKLRGAIREASKGGKIISVHGRVLQSGEPRDVEITVTPLPTSPQGGKLTLVSFVPRVPIAKSNQANVRDDIMETTSGEQALEDELILMRAELRNTIEHLETVNEDLKGSNEEAISMNEELQSTNEELETSKEELQSFNEELNTVNSQLQHKISELERTTNDLNNLLAGSETATLFLDDKLTINWFAPATKELFDLVSSDIGRPISHFARKFLDENLLCDARTVLKNLTTIESEVTSDAGRWYLRRMLPYRTRDNHIAGVVITFSDITERQTAAQAANDARVYAEAIVETIRQPLLVLDGDLRVQSANAAFYQLFQVNEKETRGNLLYDLGNRQWDIPALRTLLEAVLPKSQDVTDYEVEHEFRDIGHRLMMLNARKLVQGGGRHELILLAIEDITDRRRGESAVRASEQHFKELIEALPGAVYTTDAEGRITSYNPAAAELWGRKPALGSDAWCGSWRMYRPDGTILPHDECPMAIALKEKRAIEGTEAVAERPDGVRVPFLAYPTPLRDASGKVTGAVNMLVDITERKQAEAVAQRLAAIVESSDDAIISKSLMGTVTSWNTGAERLFGYAANEIVHKSIMTLVPPDRHDEELGILERVGRGDHIQHYETLRRRKDGTLVWVSLTVSPLRNSAGRVIGASTIARDMTERRRADEHRKTLMDELNHRVKNTMAVIQSIASQTLGHASTLDEARDAFGSRLINLAKAHDALTRESWQSANLADIVIDTVKPHAGGENRFRVEGPDIRLAPSAALAFSMALHELSTNAAKYGALTSEGGQVVVVWQIEEEDADRRLVLHWHERGGPPVAMPTRRGFGSRLIERALASELNGEVRVEYKSSGLECTIIAPMPAGREIMGGRSGQAGNEANSDR